MSEITRYRVTGTVFLVAVAVIVFPMLFDGKGMATLELPEVIVDERVASVKKLDEVAPTSDLVAKATKLREKLDSQGYRADTATKFGEPVLIPETEATHTWAVQVASLKTEENAKSLRDTLKRDGFQALLSHIRLDNQILTRVAVGPIINRSDAVSLQKTLSNRYQLEAIIVEFAI